MKIALVHDWLTGMRGGERCLEVLCHLFPDADIYTLLYKPQNISEKINNHQPVTGMLQHLPFVDRYYRNLLPIFPLAAKDLGSKLCKQHTLRNYDLVVSISHSVVKNISIPDGVKHISYCLSPMRYIWDQYAAYFEGRKLEPIVRQFAKRLRVWDSASSNGVDAFIAISEFVRKRIKRVYGRESDVIYPPVSTEWIKPLEYYAPGEYFLTANALVPYKNTHLIIEAFNRNGLKLLVLGQGPEEARCRAMARGNISFLPRVSDWELAEIYRNCRALVFAAEEDFGMIPVEVMAAGRPVIAYKRGGALETVVSQKTGLFFEELTVVGVNRAIELFMENEEQYSLTECINRAGDFSVDRFENEFLRLVDLTLNGGPGEAQFAAV